MKVKISISLPEELVGLLKSKAPDGNVSRFIEFILNRFFGIVDKYDQWRDRE